MAAFTGGIKRPQTLIPSTNLNLNQQQNQYDRLVTVLSYNIEAKTFVCEDEKGRKYEVFVNPEEVSRGEKAAMALGINRSVTWMGHSIDKQMEKNYPVGSKLILRRSRIVKKDNGRGMALTEVQRIIGVPNPEADKTFQGIFTLTYRFDENRLKRIARVQHWQNRGIDLNDDKALQELRDQMNEASARYGEKIGDYAVTVPTIGIQFRALMKTDRLYMDNTPIYEVVDSSIPFEWIPGPMDENGKEIKSKAHPINGDEMMELAKQYIDHIANHPQFAEHAKNMILEVCAYKSYPASTNSKNLQLTYGDPKRDQHAEKNILYQLSHRRSYVDIEQTEQIQGRNYAVNGIIQISPNKLAKINGKPTEIESYWVNNLHANNIKGHVFSMIRTSQGFKAEPHQNLKLIVENKKENNNNLASDDSSFDFSIQIDKESNNHSASTTQIDLDDDFDPFASEISIPETTPRVARFGRR